MMNFEFSWAVFTGVFSIFAVIPGSLLFIHSQLPSQKIRTMFEALKEADDFFLSCTEEGLVYGIKADLYRSELERCHDRAEAARFEAHAARTYIDDVANWMKGLSRTIREICWKVRSVRADISTASLRERERQAALRSLGIDVVSNSEGGQPVHAQAGDVDSPASSTSPPVSPGLPCVDDGDSSNDTAQVPHDSAPQPVSPPSGDVTTGSCSPSPCAAELEGSPCLSTTVLPTTAATDVVSDSEGGERVHADDVDSSASSDSSFVSPDLPTVDDGDSSNDTAQVPHESVLQPVSPPSEEVTAGSCTLPAAPSPCPAEDEKTPCLSMSALPIIGSLWKVAQSNRRDSVSSGSSEASLLESMRPKKRGRDALSRARTMARFVRQVCGTRSPPVFHVGLHRLATFEFVDLESDNDLDDGKDEQAFPIVTVV